MARLLYADRDEELSDVSLRVLRRVDEQPEHRGGEPRTPNLARLRQRILLGGAELIQRALHLLLERRREALHRGGWSPGDPSLARALSCSCVSDSPRA